MSEIPNAEQLLDPLRLVNIRLGTALVSLQNREASTPPEGLTVLLEDLSQASHILRTTGAGPFTDPALIREITQYRGNLEQLARLLPGIEGRLLSERARLESARTHVASALLWAQASQKTL
jgi:hypothetical protein